MFASPKFWLFGYPELQYFEKLAFLKFEFPKINIFRIVGTPDSRKPGFSKILQFGSVGIDMFGFSDFGKIGFMVFRKADYSEVHISGTPKVRTIEHLHARNFRTRKNYRDLGVC